MSKKYSLKEISKKILASPNIVSRKPVFERYDKNVQGNTTLERGRGEASVSQALRHFPELPLEKQEVGLVSAIAGNPLYGKISAFSQGENAVAEAVMKIFAVGASPLAITDCLNFGNPEKKEQMGDFVGGVKGVAESVKKLNIPIISGNVSLYNESEKGAILPSVSIFATGKIKDSKKAIGNSIPEEFRNEKINVILLGERQDELGGSIFYDILGKIGNKVPKPDWNEIKKFGNVLQEASEKELILASKVICLGGIFNALTSVSICSQLGFSLDLNKIPANKLKNFQKLFSETPGFLLFAREGDMDKLEGIFSDRNCDYFVVGESLEITNLEIINKEEKLITLNLDEISRKHEEKLLKVFF